MPSGQYTRAVCAMRQGGTLVRALVLPALSLRGLSTPCTPPKLKSKREIGPVVQDTVV